MWYHNAHADSSSKLSTVAVGWMIWVLDPSRTPEIFLISKISGPALAPTKLPV